MKPDRNKLSPMMQHYMDVKAQYPDVVLMYRLGDFYEMFFDDAVTVSRELELTLTGRDCGLEERAPMCGVPYHAVDTYVSRLIHKGYKVAICEQLTDPATSKGLVERDVVRVITPGTVIEDAILDERQNNYIASFYFTDKGCGIAYADLSTGEFKLTETKGEKALEQAENLLNGVHAAEIICNTEGKNVLHPEAIYRVKPTLYYDYAFKYSDAYDALCKQFGVSTLAAYECEDCPMGISAAGALMAYLLETQKRALTHIDKVQRVNQGAMMFFDAATRRNLELTETIRDRRKEGTLLWLLDCTETAMGARNLRRWVDAPLRDEATINDRLAAVAELIKNGGMRIDLKRVLSAVRDLERLAGKVACNTANPRDVLAISNTLVVLPVVKQVLGKGKSKLWQQLADSVQLFEKETQVVSMAIAEEPGIVLSEGGYIAAGFNKDLDELREAEECGRQWVKELEAKERAETGIKNLKIGFNHVFGYYIEVTKLNMDLVPDRYQRKQTLTNGERYKTDELIELENKVLGAHDKAVLLEQAIFQQLRTMLLGIVKGMISTANAIATADTLLSFAVVSMENNYVRPTIGSKVKALKIVGGRHPVVEKLLGRNHFTPNDTTMDDDCKTMVITGPNMAGKSTYMRQVAIIVLMAHIGCYVPAEKAEICLIDRIFTRVGASDDLSNAQSTFMVEMIEVANIMHNATSNSLLVMDEIGRGTSSVDGLAIAWSVMEYATNVLGAKTLFATHYHELTELEGKLQGVKNYRVLVDETGENVVFLHRIARGGTNKSFGIEVAAMAGVPQAVCARAKEIAKQLSRRESSDTNSIMLDAMGGSSQQQMSMFAAVDEEAEHIMNILKETDINRLTPVQAMLILQDLVERAKHE